MSGRTGGVSMLKSSSTMVSSSRPGAPPRSPSMSQSRKQTKDRGRRSSGSAGNSTGPEGTSTTTTTTTSTSSASTSTTTTSSSTSCTCTTSTTNTTTTSTATTTAKTSTSSNSNRNLASSPSGRSTSPLLKNSSSNTSHPPPRTTASSSSSSSTNTSHPPRTSSSSNHRGSITSTTTHLSAFTPITAHKKASDTNITRLVVLGSPAVGKSALVVRLLTGRFIWEYDPTLEATYRYHTTVDDDPAAMDILDTAGQTEGGVNDSNYRWGEGFVLTFSLTDRRSFTAIPDIHASVAAARQAPNFSCVIVANKIDLGHLAEVREEEASELANELGASLFFTSACDGGPAIHAAFAELYRDVVRRRWSRRRRSSAKTVIEGFYKMFSR